MIMRLEEFCQRDEALLMYYQEMFNAININDYPRENNLDALLDLALKAKAFSVRLRRNIKELRSCERYGKKVVN
jgi:hypothetical protein